MLLFYFGVPIGIEWLRADVWTGYDVFRIGSIPRNLDRGVCTALLGMCAFIFGLHLAGIRDMSQCLGPSKDRDQSLVVAGYLFTLFSMAMAAVGIAIVGPQTVFGYYGDWWAAKTAGADSRWIDVGIMFMQGGVYALLVADDRRRKWRRYFAYFVGLLIMVMAVQKGARAQLIAFGIGAGWCYSQRIRRPPSSLVIAGALVALLVLPIIGEWRQSRSIEGSKQATLHELLCNTFIDMGGSVYTLAYAMDFIPGSKRYAWGVSYRDALLQAIPNLGLKPGKSWAITTTANSPANWLVETLNPAWAAQGGGYGSAMVTELYFNFGLPGVALGATLLGFVTGRVRNAARRSELWLVASALFFAGMTNHVRDDIGSPLHMMLWPVIGLAAFRFAIAPLMMATRRRAAPAVDRESPTLSSVRGSDTPQ
jgi:oligosaccharide repeat unit polymerase